MKLFLIWPTQAPEVNVLLNELTNAGHEIAYWVGEYPVAHLNPRGCVFHDHYDAWDGKPAAALKDVAFAPVSADLASKCFAVESAALSMMDKRYDSAPVSERKHIYYAMLSYWNGVLDRYKPDAVVFANIPHSVYNYILYELARARGLRTPCFEETWVASRFLMYEDFWNGSDELRTEIKRTLAHGAKESELGEELRAYWEEQTRPHSQAAPVYMANRRSTSEGWGLLKHRVRIAYKALLAGNLPSLVYGYIRRPGKKDLKKEYARVVREADWNTPFVYFPLHFQPERTTSPQGGVYNDQLLVVETLSASLPEGWEIYLKEHPSQWWLRSKTRYSSVRYRGYYERLAAIPRVRLVPITTNTFELTERARAVAVITGTSGLEALLRGKCPLVFGIPWYRDCPGVFRVDSVESCAKALEKIKQGAQASKESVLCFLRAIEKVSIRAYLDGRYEKHPRFTETENMQMIASRLCERLASPRT